MSLQWHLWIRIFLRFPSKFLSRRIHPDAFPDAFPGSMPAILRVGQVFPSKRGFNGGDISMYHIGSTPMTVPLPATRHLNAHLPGGFRYNVDGPGSALPFYPPKLTES